MAGELAGSEGPRVRCSGLKFLNELEEDSGASVITGTGQRDRPPWHLGMEVPSILFSLV